MSVGGCALAARSQRRACWQCREQLRVLSAALRVALPPGRRVGVRFRKCVTLAARNRQLGPRSSTRRRCGSWLHMGRVPPDAPTRSPLPTAPYAHRALRAIAPSLAQWQACLMRLAKSHGRSAATAIAAKQSTLHAGSARAPRARSRPPLSRAHSRWACVLGLQGSQFTLDQHCRGDRADREPW